MALAGLGTFALLLLLVVTGAFAAVIAAHIASLPEAGPWPVDFRPTLGELGVMTSGTYWAEEYLPSLEELSAIVSPLSEFTSLGGSVLFAGSPVGLSPLYTFSTSGAGPGCDGCHLPLRGMYPSGDPAAAFHCYPELHPDECDCIDCHLPPHPVLDDCKCCTCHGCWDTGWTVEAHLELSECLTCHEQR